MSPYTFRELKLEYGEMIYLINEKGEGYSGTYENDYNNSTETFRFSNYSNGKIETIRIESLQFLKRYSS